MFLTKLNLNQAESVISESWRPIRPPYAWFFQYYLFFECLNV